MMWASLCIIAAFVACLISGTAEAADSSKEVVSFVVATSADADDLADDLVNSGSVHIAVNWHGRVKLTRTLALENNSTLEIIGSEEAVIDGGGTMSLLTVSGGATLNLNNIALEKGWTDSSGGAIFAYESSVAVHDCRFSGNIATNGGGECYGWFAYATRVIRPLD